MVRAIPVHALVYGDNSLLSHDPVVLFTPKVSGQYDVFIGGHGGVGTYDLHAPTSLAAQLRSATPLGELGDDDFERYPTEVGSINYTQALKRRERVCTLAS